MQCTINIGEVLCILLLQTAEGNVMNSTKKDGNNGESDDSSELPRPTLPGFGYGEDSDDFCVVDDEGANYIRSHTVTLSDLARDKR